LLVWSFVLNRDPNQSLSYDVESFKTLLVLWTKTPWSEWCHLKLSWDFYFSWFVMWSRGYVVLIVLRPLCAGGHLFWKILGVGNVKLMQWCL
jgi:hypothetical protein